MRFLILLASLSPLLAGCDSSFVARQALVRQLMAVTKETADLLATVKDKPTAQAAAPQLLTLVERSGTLSERLEELDEDADDLGSDPAAIEEYGQWIAEHSRLMQEQHRIGQIPDAREGLGEGWERLTGGAYDPGGIFAPGGAMDLGQGAKP